MIGKGIRVLTGIIANDLGSVWEKVGKQIQGNEQILANNDLKKAVGMAIAPILYNHKSEGAIVG